MKPFHRHRKRPIGVPRGMLRPITLILLNEQPMSGSEIAEAIEYYAEWKPSPGSIYPLLSSLEEEGFIELSEDDEPSLKRFTLTEKGKEHLKVFADHDKEIRKRNKNMRRIYWRLFRGMSEEMYQSFSDLFDRIEEYFDSIEDIDEFKAIIDSAIIEIEKLGKKKNE